MPRTRQKAKARREQGAFVAFPCNVLNHPNFINLSAKGTRLLMDICSQLRFKEGGPMNNGDLCVTLSVMKNRGWNSNESLRFALAELLYYEFIVITRQGGRNLCSLYAVTWWAINECDGKLDMQPSRTPSNEWRQPKKKWERPKRKLNSLGRFPSLGGPYNGLMKVRDNEKFTH